MGQHSIKEEIIAFVQNSPEEECSKVSIFIAGMQAQKNLKNSEYQKEEIPASGMDNIHTLKRV